MKKTRKIAVLMGMAALAAATEPSMVERARVEVGPAEPEAARPIGVLVMAVGRSGSTMVGELFRQNKDVLYFYEPCRKLSGKDIVGLECLALLQRLTQCTFSPEDSAWVAGDFSSCERGSPVLKSLVAAKGTKKFAQAHEDVVDTCMQSKAVAVKSIRLGEGLGDKDYDLGGLKVLHLVRDPRGVVRSQREHFRISWGSPAGADSRKSARAGGVSICGTYRCQLDTSQKLEKNRYLRVRYEDVATSPELAVELIYCWSGLSPVPPSVSQWIESNTNMPTCGDGAHRTRHLRAANTTYSSFGYSYTTTPEYSFGYSYATTPEHPSAGSDGAEAFVRADQRALGIPEPGASEAAAAAVVSRRVTKGGGGGGRGGGGGSKNNKNNDRKKPAECLENTKEAKHNPYGTKRQSAAMVSMWRTLMSEQDAQAVWEGCEDSGVMGALGYGP